MAFGGIGLGGVAEGMNAAEKVGIADRQQQATESYQRRQQDLKIMDDAVKAASELAGHVASAGQDPKTLANNPAFTTLVQASAEAAKRAGVDPQMAVGRAMSALSRPPTSKFELKNIPGEGITDSNQAVVFDPRTGETRPVARAASPMIATGEGLPPSGSLPLPGTVPTQAPSVSGPAAVAQGPQQVNDAGGVGETGANLPAQSPADAARAAAGMSATPAPLTVPPAEGPPALNPGALPAARGPAQTAAIRSKVSTSDSIDFLAEQAMEGNPKILQNMRGKVGQAKREAIQERMTELAIARGISPQDLNARTQSFMGETKAAQIIGNRIGALESGIANVLATAPLVDAISARIDRTKYPTINSLIVAGKTQTGDEDIVRLGIALNTLVTSFARSQGGSSVLTDQRMADANKMLNINYSHGQLRAGVDQLTQEMQRELIQARDTLRFFGQKNRPAASSQPPPASGAATAPPGGSADDPLGLFKK